MINFFKSFLLIIVIFSFGVSRESKIQNSEILTRGEFDPGEGEFSIIYDSINKSKNEIYSICLDWLSDSYKSPKHIVNQNDREAGIIFIKGAEPNQKFLISVSDIEYTFKIQIKDNKIKLTFVTGHILRDDGTPYPTYPSRPAVKRMILIYEKLSNSLITKIKLQNEEDF